MVPAAKEPKSLRSDIQGMRAVAVTTVLLFHAGLVSMGGGYVGVDVFFVISGFLITSLLIREIERSGRVSLVQFYARRLKRLAPTYLVVLVLTALFVIVFLSPLQQVEYLPQIGWAVLCGANLTFAWNGTGYFAAAEPSPVLHFWSLAVEEQFYLVWPFTLIVLAWLARRLRRPLRTTLVVAFLVMTVLSFALGVWGTDNFPTQSYYLLPTRAWQLSVGGLLAAVPISTYARLRPWIRAVLLLVGLAMVLWSAWAYTARTPFPGTAALVPVVGAALLIVSGTGGAAPFASGLLGSKPMTVVGDISYSLYLWHWPILVLPTMVHGDPIALPGRLALVALSFATAYASYRLIEAPLHHLSLRGRLRRVYVVALSASTALAVLVAGTATVIERRADTRPSSAIPDIGLVAASAALPQEYLGLAGGGLGEDGRVVDPDTLSPSLGDIREGFARVFDDGCAQGAGSAVARGCTYGNPQSDETIVLVGDSHAGQWFPAVEAAVQHRDARLVTFLKNGCPAVFVPEFAHPAYPTDFLCSEWRHSAWAQIRELKPRAVVVSNFENGLVGYDGMPQGAGYDDAWMRGMTEMMRNVPSGAKVLMIADNPSAPRSVNYCLSGNLESPRNCDLHRKDGVREDLQRRATEMIRQSGGQWVDAPALLCRSDGSCPVLVGHRVVFRDKDHLQPGFVELFAPLVAKRVDDLLAG